MHVYPDGTTAVGPKLSAQAVVVWLQSENSNVAANVTNEHLMRCEAKLKAVEMKGQTLENMFDDAIWEQHLSRRYFATTEKVNADCHVPPPQKRRRAGPFDPHPSPRFPPPAETTPVPPPPQEEASPPGVPGPAAVASPPSVAGPVAVQMRDGVAGPAACALTEGFFKLVEDGQPLTPFSVTRHGNAEPGAPLLLFLPGAGGETKLENLPLGRAPKPCWQFVLNLPGKHKIRTPTSLISVLQIMRQWTVGTANTIVVLGFSRGAAWVLDLCLEHAHLIDGAIAIAPYPWTKHREQNQHEARQLM